MDYKWDDELKIFMSCIPFWFLDKENGNKKPGSTDETTDFQQESCIHMYKTKSNKYTSNSYNFKKRSGTECNTGASGSTYKGQSFICQKSLGTVNNAMHTITHLKLTTFFSLWFWRIQIWWFRTWYEIFDLFKLQEQDNWKQNWGNNQFYQGEI